MPLHLCPVGPKVNFQWPIMTNLPVALHSDMDSSIGVQNQNAGVSSLFFFFYGKLLRLYSFKMWRGELLGE